MNVKKVCLNLLLGCFEVSVIFTVHKQEILISSFAIFDFTFQVNSTLIGVRIEL